MSLPVINFVIFSVMYILLCWGTYLPIKAGFLYLGSIYCMAGGAYFSAYAATVWEWPIGLAMLSGPVVGAVFALVPALGLRKVGGFTLAIASMALVFIIQTVIINCDFIGGQAGFFGVPMVEHMMWISLFILALAGVVVHRVDHSMIGRAAETLAHNQDLAKSCGVDPRKMNIVLQMVCGAFSGMAGAIFAFNVGSVFPAAFGFGFLLNLVVMLFVGGIQTMWGAVIFAPIMWGFPLLLPAGIAEWKDVIYGGMLIVILLLRPEGVITKKILAFR